MERVFPQIPPNKFKSLSFWGKWEKWVFYSIFSYLNSQTWKWKIYSKNIICFPFISTHFTSPKWTINDKKKKKNRKCFPFA